MSRARPDTPPSQSYGSCRCGIVVCVALLGILGCTESVSPVLSVSWNPHSPSETPFEPAELDLAVERSNTFSETIRYAAHSLEAGWKPEAESRPWDRVVLHHTATATGNVNSIDTVHKRKKDSRGVPWLGIGYHFVIGNGQGMPDGAVEPTFRWRQQLPGAHAGDAEINQFGVGIALVGNFDKAPPTPAQQESVIRLIRHLLRTLELTPEQVIGHGDIKATACPGRYFSLDTLRASVAALDDSGGPPLARFVPATGIPRKEALRK